MFYTHDGCFLLKDNLNASFAVPVGQARAFRDRWLVSAAYHDIGYVLENEQAINNSGSAWQRTRTKMNDVMAAPLSSMESLRSIVSSKELEQKLIEIHGLPAPPHIHSGVMGDQPTPSKCQAGH
jgi:hypothetical protein